MSEIKVNKISPRAACGTTTLGDSGDTFNLPSGATLTVASGATITNQWKRKQVLVEKVLLIGRQVALKQLHSQQLAVRVIL